MRSRPLAVAAGGLALVVVLVVGIVIGRGSDNGAGDGSDGTGAPRVPASAPSAGTPGAPDPTTALATLGPVDTAMYDLPGGVRLPRSPTAGPANTDNYLALGFARTPLGAAVAAVNIGTRTNGFMGEPIYRPTLERQVIGPGQQDLLLLAERRGNPQVPGPEDRVSAASVRYYGFTIDAYNPQVATVSYLGIVPRDGKEIYYAQQVTLRWVDGDWRLVAPPDGDFTGAAKIVSSVVAFHPFA